MLSRFPEKCAGCEAELQRTQLHALLRKHKEEQTSKGGRFLGEKGCQRRLEGENRVCQRGSLVAYQVDAMRLT